MLLALHATQVMGRVGGVGWGWWRFFYLHTCVTFLLPAHMWHATDLTFLALAHMSCYGLDDSCTCTHVTCYGLEISCICTHVTCYASDGEGWRGWGGDDDVSFTCTHVTCTHVLAFMFDVAEQVGLGWGGVKFLHIEQKIKQVSFIPTRPPTTYVHTRLVDYIPVVMFTIYPPMMFTIDPPYAEKNSWLRLHARQFQCKCPSHRGRPYRF